MNDTVKLSDVLLPIRELRVWRDRSEWHGLLHGVPGQAPMFTGATSQGVEFRAKAWLHNNGLAGEVVVCERFSDGATPEPDCDETTADWTLRAIRSMRWSDWALGVGLILGTLLAFALLGGGR